MLPTAYAREVLGDEVELCHDTHERLAPSMTVQLAKSLEPYRLFFLEDSLPPEQSEADAFLLALLRAAAARLTPRVLRNRQTTTSRSCASTPASRSRWASCSSMCRSVSARISLSHASDFPDRSQ